MLAVLLIFQTSAFSKVCEVERRVANPVVGAEHVSIWGREAGFKRRVLGVGEGRIAARADDGLAKFHHALHARERCRGDQNDGVRKAIMAGVE